jgi:hypothetical protein
VKHEIPSFEEVKKGIDELLLVDKWDKYKILKNPNFFYNKVNSLFLSKLRFFPTIMEYSNSNDFPFKFYRLRKEIKGFNPDLISDHSHPPASVMNYHQRANIPNHPVLYCSDNPNTALTEVLKLTGNVNKNEKFYLSEWEIVPDKEIKLSPYFFGNLNQNSFYNKWSDSNFNKLKITLEKEGIGDSYNSMKHLLTFLSNLFVAENSYVVSSYIAHSHLYAEHTLRSDIFVYPSVQLDRKSVNYAIHPNFACENMRLKRIFQISLDSFEKGENISITFHNLGINKNSMIFWNKKISENLDLIKEVFPDLNFNDS